MNTLASKGSSSGSSAAHSRLKRPFFRTDPTRPTPSPPMTNAFPQTGSFFSLYQLGVTSSNTRRFFQVLNFSAEATTRPSSFSRTSSLLLQSLRYVA